MYEKGNFEEALAFFTPIKEHPISMVDVNYLVRWATIMLAGGDRE